MTNPSRYWAELGAQNKTGQELCDGIVNILVKYCFVEDLIPVATLKAAMPIIYSKLTASIPENRSSSMALDAARTAGLFDIGKAKKESEDRLVFEAAIIMLLYLRQDIVNYNYPYKSIEEFLTEYPDFQKENEEEIVKLFNFANCMKVAVQLIKPKLHKSQLLVLCTRLTEGKGVKYVTGSGQKAETKRRVAIYEHEGGVKAEQRPWRLSWNLITQLLSDEKDSVEEVDLTQKLISTIQDQPDMRDVELNQESIRFRHPSIPNVHVEATEMKTASGQTLMRATTLSRVREDEEGNVVAAQELHREFSVTGEVYGNTTDDLAWLNEFDDALIQVENNLGEGVGDFSVSRQCVRSDGQLLKAITVSRQFTDNMVMDTGDGKGDITFEELEQLSEMLGGSITRQFSGGAYGLLRSLSSGASAGGAGSSPRMLPPNSVSGGLGSFSPRGRSFGGLGPGSLGLGGGNSSSSMLDGPLLTGLSRMNSTNTFLPTGSTLSPYGLIRSFSGPTDLARTGSSQSNIQTPILTFPNGVGSTTGLGIADSNNRKQQRAVSDGSSNGNGNAIDLEPYKRVKLELPNGLSSGMNSTTATNTTTTVAGVAAMCADTSNQ